VPQELLLEHDVSGAAPQVIGGAMTQLVEL
jgi:hypothetical protein